MVKIFINYRSADEPYGAAMLDNYLSDRFGSEHVFRASKSIPPGEVFVEHILRAVRESSVLLAVIGAKWLTVSDGRGNRRLDDPVDLVRREIAEALHHGVVVIPILMNAPRITGAALPPDIAALAERQDVRLHFRGSGQVLRGLVEILEQLIPELEAKPQQVRKDGFVITANTVGAVFNETVNVEGGFTVNKISGRDRGGAR